ncbi:MAG: peptide chain release factor N(5)-glutamine methyltransferase [Lachnospiraceae bacterium]|nr:peptide chain release factor N(5)-glutamine methyltransferase [Lachnospiraceae bacterium]
MLPARELLQKGIRLLTEAGITDAEVDARILLEEICHITRTDLLLRPTQEVEESQYLACIEKRLRHIPLQHILGKAPFMGHSFYVSDKVLVPRADTEILTELAINALPADGRVLDLCTGSGCILCSVLLAMEMATGEGIDISVEALEIAQKNLQQFPSLENRGKVYQSNLFENVESTFDVIVSNPPYICTDVIETLSPEVKDHDPRLALDGGVDGLDFYRSIIQQAGSYLKDGGQLLFEIGYDQGMAVSNLMTEKGFVEVTVIKDYAGLDRVVKGIWLK